MGWVPEFGRKVKVGSDPSSWLMLSVWLII